VAEPAGNVVSLDRRPNSTNLAGTALDLVAQAADLIRDADNAAAEKTACAEALANQAIEKLKTAFDRLRASESHRNALEIEIKTMNDAHRLASLRLQEFEQTMEQVISRVEDAEARLSIAHDRANAAEEPLKCIEEAIRSRILERFGRTFFGNVSALAHRAA
jgi:chromosome segregation ATPase